MKQILPLAIFAGLVSALMSWLPGQTFIISSPLLTIILLSFFPLPLFAAGLVAGMTGAAFAGITGIVLTTTLSGPIAAVWYGLGAAAPAIILSYLANLRREVELIPAPDGPAGPDTPPPLLRTEWFPEGYLIAAAGMLAVVLSMVVFALLDQSISGYETTVRETLTRVINERAAARKKAVRSDNPTSPKPDSPSSLPVQPDRLLMQPAAGDDQQALRRSFYPLIKALDRVMVDIGGLPDRTLSAREHHQYESFIIRILPAIFALSIFLSALLNLWLASVLVRSLHLPMRPVADLASIRYPRFFSLAMVVAILANYLTGLIGIMATSATLVFFTAWLIMGLAVLHYITRGIPLRPVLLGAVYLAVLFLGIGIFVIFIGILEPLVNLRRRAGMKS